MDFSLNPFKFIISLMHCSDIDYDALWNHVVKQPTHRPPHSVHGPDHWLRVERNACILASRTGALIHVVRLFALFHDSRRVNDGSDPRHGARGAKYATELRGHFFDLPDEDFHLLTEACRLHTGGGNHENATIGTCWDADRLDLGRVGITPNARYMSTDFAREIADHGTIDPWIECCVPHLGDPWNHGLKFR